MDEETRLHLSYFDKIMYRKNVEMADFDEALTNLQFSSLFPSDWWYALEVFTSGYGLVEVRA